MGTAAVRYQSVLRTAGKHFRELLKEIENKQSDAKVLTTLKTRLDTFQQHLLREFFRCMQNVEMAFDFVESLPKKQRESARNDLYILMSLLRPNKYQHLITYMKVPRPRGVGGTKRFK